MQADSKEASQWACCLQQKKNRSVTALIDVLFKNFLDCVDDVEKGDGFNSKVLLYQV